MNDLKFKCGWWFPQSEMHLVEIMEAKKQVYKNRFSYQYNKFSMCVNSIPSNRRRLVLDIGSNIGTWTYNLVDFFDFVHCFEPIKVHRNCWVKNLEGYTNTVLYDVALGDENEKAKMFVPDICTAGAYIAGPKNHATDKPKEAHKDVIVVEDIIVERLDNYNFENVDFIKIDVEGYELNVLKGAKETILKNKPYIFLEQKADNLYGVEFLESMGMHKIYDFDEDYFMGWRALTKKEQTENMRRMFGNSEIELRMKEELNE